MTARTAADLLNIQPNTAALFYHEIGLVIDYYLSLEADELFEGEVELDESYFGGVRKGKRVYHFRSRHQTKHANARYQA